jgi:hypothetical protein
VNWALDQIGTFCHQTDSAPYQLEMTAAKLPLSSSKREGFGDLNILNL